MSKTMRPLAGAAMPLVPRAVRWAVVRRGGRKPWVVEITSRAAEAAGLLVPVPMPTAPPSRVLPPVLGAMLTFWAVPPAATVRAPVPVRDAAVTAPVKAPVAPVMLPATLPVTLPVTLPTTLPLTLPARLAVMVPAEKSPEASRLTRVAAVLALVAALAAAAPAATLAALRLPTVATVVAPWVPVTSPARLPEKLVTPPAVVARGRQAGTVPS